MEQKKSSKKNRASRTRNYATVVYPESAPENWIDIVKNFHVPVFISPLHDLDKNPDGELKKPHFHVLFMFDTVKDWETQVKQMFEKFGGVGREKVNSTRGYARYLCHLDNPEKMQYKPQDVISLGGADYNAVVHLPTDDMKMLKEIFTFIRVNQIYSLAELIDICAETNLDWFSLICMSRAYVVDKYIKSLTWEEECRYKRREENI